MESKAKDEKPKPKPVAKIKSLETTVYDYSFATDESLLDDDTENDPDWRGTPLFRRIQKLEVKSICLCKYNFTLFLQIYN